MNVHRALLVLFIACTHSLGFAEENTASTFPKRLDTYQRLHTQMVRHFQNVMDLQRGLPFSETNTTHAVLSASLGVELSVSHQFQLYFLEQQMLNKTDRKEIRKAILGNKAMVGKICNQAASGMTTQIAATTRELVAREIEQTRESIVEICDFFDRWD